MWAALLGPASILSTFLISTEQTASLIADAMLLTLKHAEDNKVSVHVSVQH